MEIIGYIRKIILLGILIIVLGGCSNSYKNEYTVLKDENKQLKQQLSIVNEKIKYQEELYDLRNILDLQTHEMIYKLSKGDISYLKENTTNNITFLGDKLISSNTNIGSKSEFEIPREQFSLRQRAYMLSENKQEYHSIYEFFPTEESNIFKTLHVYFVLNNGQWKLDTIFEDE